jgi:polysaccharide export outer membrane protein
MRILFLFALLPVLAGCLPSAGPRTVTIVSAAQQSVPPFAVVPLSPEIADFLASRSAASLASTFGMGSSAPTITLGVGDFVVVSIYEAASGGLFSGDAGTLGGASKSVILPEQPVTQQGTISVPYVGQVHAQGLTPAQVQREIEAALKDKAIEPQAIVTVVRSPSTFVTVTGDVGTSSRIPLTYGGDRLLDVVATAGGTRAPDYDTFVRLTRGSSSATTVRTSTFGRTISSMSTPIRKPTRRSARRCKTRACRLALTELRWPMQLDRPAVSWICALTRRVSLSSATKTRNTSRHSSR